MKVVLLKDVPQLGKRFDVKNVSDGHALNFLIPRGLVQAATDALVKNVEKQKADAMTRRKNEEEAVFQSLEQAKAKPIVITEKANEKGHLFSAIHKDEIVAAIKKTAGVELTDDLVKLDKPIKEVGDHMVEITAAGKTVKVKVTVKAAKE